MIKIIRELFYIHLRIKKILKSKFLCSYKLLFLLYLKSANATNRPIIPKTKKTFSTVVVVQEIKKTHNRFITINLMSQINNYIYFKI